MKRSQVVECATTDTKVVGSNPKVLTHLALCRFMHDYQNLQVGVDTNNKQHKYLKVYKSEAKTLLKTCLMLNYISFDNFFNLLDTKLNLNLRNAY